MFLAPCNHIYSTSIYRMMLWQKSLHIIEQIDHVQSLLLASPRVLWAIWVLLWANSCGLIAVFQMVGLLKTLPENIMSKLIMSHLYSACVIKDSLASGNTFFVRERQGCWQGHKLQCYNWQIIGTCMAYNHSTHDLQEVSVQSKSAATLEVKCSPCTCCWCTITTPTVAS